MSAEAREAALNVDLAFWASDAGACPRCGKKWTVERIKSDGATVRSVDPRVLVCSRCWTAEDAVACRTAAGGPSR